MTRFPPAASPSPVIDGGQSEEKRWRGIQGISLAGLFFNLTAGFTVCLLLRLPWAGNARDEMLHSAIALGIAWGVAWLGIRAYRPFFTVATFPKRRIAAILLVGVSLAALVWYPHFDLAEHAALIVGLLIRWGLFAGELREIREMDRNHAGLPSAAARMRLGITSVTGIVLPLLWMLHWGPAFWLLLLSFLLTVFSQWTAMAEMHYRLADPAAGM